MNSMTRCTSPSRKAATVFFSAFALSCAAICSAADGTSTETGTETVKFTDLNVLKPADAAALYYRITIAATDVCKSLDHGELGSKVLFLHCVDHAIADAVAKIDQPALYAVYNVKNPAAKTVRLAAGQVR
jgi:UrcA family protein